jgi:fibro-slime domain-containing protein
MHAMHSVHSRGLGDKTSTSFWGTQLLRFAGVCVAVLPLGCAATSNNPRPFDDTPTGGQGGGGGGAAGAAGGSGVVGQGGISISIVDAAPGPISFVSDGALPEGFTAATMGGFQLGDPLTGGDAGSATNAAGCQSVLTGVVRDFPSAHPDFGHYCCGDMRGVIAPALGDDQKPVYTLPGPFLIPNTTQPLSTGPDQFNQWYRSVDGINQPFLVYLFFVPSMGGVFTFQSSAFFPLDDHGFGNEYQQHNYGFTTELHTAFKYNGGETFRFTGDDDLWVFINRKLAIDLGGVHQAEAQLVSLDASAASLGITIGTVYRLDLFQAERHPSDSNFRVDTNLEFVDCGTIVDVR